jgi:hypothetical protein
VFDLGSRTGVWVNGQRCSASALSEGDRVTVGPFGLLVHAAEGLTSMSMGPGEPEAKQPSEAAPAAPAARLFSPASAADAPTKSPCGDEAEADPLQSDISATWERLNSWRSQLQSGTAALEEQQRTVSVRELEVDARDAAMRGQLHDVARFHEQVIARERELAAKAAQVQAELDVLEAGKKTAAQRDADLDRRDQELSRREHAVAQRWTRILATTCPHCQKPISFGNVD